ncbi:transcriptional regulator [Marmoricola endophyticus]|uniref:Transcriptional regulator n=1 Tax=Marmoricola endophyticus TaxID=2040280 RepID=A0A917BK46_9ACTN|nr:FCD domain-containing protein [Marmoricola endophyticus]GGF45947.1 transcriptional regulator [Marmoricola endophyticus]
MPPEIAPVTVRTAVDEVVDRLLTTIASGEVSVGERLPAERELARMLGVSRPTVRSAVAHLRGIGALEVVRGRNGGHVVQASWAEGSEEAVRRTLASRWDEVEDLLDTRCLVESLVARTAAERRTDDDVAALREALAANEAAEEPADVRRASAALHAAVDTAARAGRLATYSRQLLAQANQGLPVEPYLGRLTDRSRGEHRDLVEAVVAGDADRAAEVARTHFAITAENLRALAGR